MNLYKINIDDFNTLTHYEKYNNELNVEALRYIEAQGYYSIDTLTAIININHTFNPKYSQFYPTFRNLLLIEIRNIKINELI